MASIFFDEDNTEIEMSTPNSQTLNPTMATEDSLGIDTSQRTFTSDNISTITIFADNSSQMSEPILINNTSPGTPAINLSYVDDFHQVQVPRKRRGEYPNIEMFDSQTEDNNSTKGKKALLNKSTSSNDENQSCPICFEPWTTSGLHRLVSLKCGHLYGSSCIEKWLRSNVNQCEHKCPQCKTNANIRDIRPIYARNLIAVDNSELEQALRAVEAEKTKVIQAKKTETIAILQFHVAKTECENMRAKIIELELKLANATNSRIIDPNNIQKMDEIDIPQASNNRSFDLVRTLTTSTTGKCRIIEINQDIGMIVVSKPSVISLYRGYGISKISCQELKDYQYVPIHNDVIRDLKFCPNKSDILLSVSTDKSAKLTSMSSNSNVLTFAIPYPSWACTWDFDDPNYMHIALTNGTIEIFDIRQTTSCVCKMALGNNRPITSLDYISGQNSTFPALSGTLCATIFGCYFNEKNSSVNYTVNSLPDLDGNCTSISYLNNKFLTSFRPTLAYTKTRHVVSQLALSDLTDMENQSSKYSITQLHQFTGGSSQAILSRSCMFSPISDPQLSFVAFGDEASKSLSIWNIETKRQSSFSTSKAIVDTAAYGNYLAALTDDKLNIYEWK